jgi:hypothetical protein
MNNELQPPAQKRSTSRKALLIVGGILIAGLLLVEFALLQKLYNGQLSLYDKPIESLLASWSLSVVFGLALYLVALLPAGIRQKIGTRRWLIPLLWVITLTALFYRIENWRGQRAWSHYRQHLESNGVPLSYTTFVPKPVPEEQNFAATPFVRSWFSTPEGSGKNIWNDHFDTAHKVSTAQGLPLIQLANNQEVREFINLSDWARAFQFVDSGQEASGEKPVSGKLDAQSRAAAAPTVLEGLGGSNPHIEELRDASQRPLASYPVVYLLDDPWATTIPHLAQIKAAMFRLQLRACSQLATGKTADALADIKLMFYMIDSIKNEPILISFLVRIACLNVAIQPVWEGLAEHRWSEPQLKELQASFEGYDFVGDLKPALDGERAAGMLTAELVRKKGLGYFVALAEANTPSANQRMTANVLGWFVPSGWYYQEQLNYARLFQLQIEGTYDVAQKRVFPSQLQSNVTQLNRELENRPFLPFLSHNKLAALLLPALDKSVLRAASGKILADQAVLACALERFRLANGQFPENLNALAPQIMNRLPHDPLTGDSYKYRRQDDAFVLYSVGLNQTDDGGKPGKVQYDRTEGDVVWSYPPAP